MSNLPTLVRSQVRTSDLELLRQLDTGDLSKTEEVYKENGILYEKPPGQKKKERFLAQVTNSNTGEFLQPETLRAAGLVPNNYQNSKKYPIKTVNSIIRLRTPEGKEWLISRQTWTGLDRLGNEVSKTVDDQEMWLKPVLRYDSKRANPNDPFSRMETKVSVSDFTKEYTLPFNAKNADELYKMKKPGENISLVIKDLSTPDGKPRSVPRYEDFKNREFDELEEELSTPKFSLDRSIKDNLQDQQYG